MNSSRLAPLLALFGLAFALVALPSLAQEAPAKEAQEKVSKEVPAEFLRITRNRAEEPTRLQTAVVRYVPESEEGELTVDLIGAVHIGDRSYYKDLQELFEQYDALLFELVMPEGAEVPDGVPDISEDPFAVILDLLMGMFQLESQTDHIDYTKENFVHADLSPEGMAEAMRKRGDDAVTVTLGLLADMIRQQNLAEMKQEENPEAFEPPEIDPLALLIDPNEPIKLKRFLAEQLVDNATNVGMGITMTTILITDRNEACMKVFQQELARGKKKIGIFYGAAHMEDFDERLIGEFGLKRQGVTWLTAWDLR